MDEDGEDDEYGAKHEPVEPKLLGFQIIAKTAAVLVPYMIAASSWLEFRWVGAMMFGVYLQNTYVYCIALGLYVAMLISSGIVAVAHYGQDESVPDDNRILQRHRHRHPPQCAEELQRHPPQQGCCAGDRKRHKPAADALATRDLDMEAGAGQRLLH